MLLFPSFPPQKPPKQLICVLFMEIPCNNVQMYVEIAYIQHFTCNFSAGRIFGFICSTSIFYTNLAEYL